MRTTIELPESVYRQSEKIARQKGASVEQLFVQTLERVLEEEPSKLPGAKSITFPLLSSKCPGTLDLTDFNFDDLLA